MWSIQIGKEPYENHSEKNRALHNTKKNNKTTKKKSPDRRRLAKSSKKQHSENTDKWHFCKAGSFSYGESPRTPPLEGTSLHRWNISVERPWGILSLFTTCLQVQSPCHSLWHMWLCPKQHTKKRGDLGNTKNTKITRRRAGTWAEVYEKDPKGNIQNKRSPMKC